MNNVEVEVGTEQENSEIQDLINQLPFDDSLLADEYLNIENNIVAGELVMEDEDIIALIQPNLTEINEQQDESFIPEISITDTIVGVENLLNFLVYPPNDFDVSEDELKCIRTLRKKLLTHKNNSSVQQSLDKFFCLE